MMKAAWYERNGAARDVLIIGELPKPQPGPGEVLVRVLVSGINPSDVKGRRGRPLPGPRVVPHSDGAGIVEAVGEGIPEKRIGERVWLWNGQWKRAFGPVAEDIALPEQQAVVDFPKAWILPSQPALAFLGLTAMHAVNLLDLTKGKTVLVTRTMLAITPRRSLPRAGLQVIGTASP